MKRQILDRAAIACGLMLTAAATRAHAGDPACGVMMVVPRAGALVISLPHTFIRAHSDSVWSSRGAWRSGADYSLDRLRGELRLLREAAPGETLRVRGCWLIDPPPLEVQHDRYRPAAAGRDSAPAAWAPPEPRPVTAHAAAPPSGASLALTGNKTLAVEFGSSQDAVLRQSLDLALSGSVAPGVQLTGVLSDRNTPITAAGTTLDLQSVDQVRIELAAPQGGATLGDLSLRLEEGEFARLERRLQGVRAEWGAGGAHALASAASASGEYRRIELYGTDGLQGPYLLTDRDGGTGISVVAGSEIVVLDGARLSRGETADYSMDYERARLTFSNRHLITAGSRITVDYQFTLRRYRRNFSAASARWEHGAFSGFARLLNEADDRGRPIGVTLSAEDRLVLAAAGDSAMRAIGPGVTAGAGDYDTVRVSPQSLAFAFAGPDSGHYSVQFAPVGAGRGDYVDSAVVAGRTAYRYVGSGLGAFVVGRRLPLPESHGLWALGAGVRSGAASIEVEGAGSRLDPNTFSGLDAGGHDGFAGRARVRLERLGDGALGGVSLELEGRAVDERFAPFTRLEHPFEAERWALPAGADFAHARRASTAAEWRPSVGGQMRADAGMLRTPDGYDSKRAGVEWNRTGAFETHALWERAVAEHASSLHSDGGRDHARAEARWRLPWLVPMMRAEFDERRFPSDSGQVGDRFRRAGGELASGSRLAWRATAGADLRRDARLTASGFEDQSESRTLRLALDTPAGRALTASVLAQRHDVIPLADPRRTRNDLASARLRAEDARRGLRGELDTEIGSEGENHRVRTLVYAGPGKGAYDALGNFVGTGDYTLTLTVSPELERVARAASHARASWMFGEAEAWRGSRVELTYESEARRPGGLEPGDALVSPGGALTQSGLVRAGVLERLESDLAPGSRSAAVRARLERRVSADRTFDNFTQTTDDRQISVRWRLRPSRVVSGEFEALARQQVATQSVKTFSSYHRAIDQRGGSAQLIATPDSRVRVVAVAELSWARPTDQPQATRTLAVGPDLGLTIGRRGRAELTFRRAFVNGPPAVSLIPSADPAGAPHWQGTSRFDYRLLESFTLGVSGQVREFTGHRAVVTGRAEMRAFF